MKRATIRDVAREAQVSVASVSRALNGLPTVTAATRDHIRAIADRLGYVPHAGARSLSLSRTNAIGVVLPDLHGEFFSELVRGMDRATAARGFQMLFSTMHADLALARQAMMAMHGRVDGLIVMAPQLAPDSIAAVMPRGTPAVLINSPDGGIHDQLRIDNAAGMETIVRHLVSQGARRLVHITGPDGNLDADERLAAFRAALTDSAPEVSTLVVSGDFRDESGYARIAQLIDAGETFDAVVAANDGMALGALRALGDAGRSVPGDVMVAGFDDIPLARHLGLTTMRVPLDEMGDLAVALLIDRLEGRMEAPLRRRILPELIERASTARDAPRR